MGNGFDDNTYAWLRLRNQIKKVEIADGVSTGASAGYLFNGCSNLTSINIEALDTLECHVHEPHVPRLLVSYVVELVEIRYIQGQEHGWDVWRL